MAPSAAARGVSLREAVNHSPTGSLITFAPGLSGGTITLTHADGDMEIPGALSIDASALPGGLTVSGNGTSRHFHLDTGKSLTLRGLTLTGGNGVGSPTFGGSIISGGTLNLHHCTLTGNGSTSDGGAIFSAGTLRATDCTLSENTSGIAGGAIVLYSGTAELTHCTLSGNTASDGGALYQQGATTTTLSHCTVAGNGATDGQGGLAALDGTLNLQHCTISQNTGIGIGGGLYLQTPAIVNVATSIIAGNTDLGSTVQDIFHNGGTLTAIGINLIGNNTGGRHPVPRRPARRHRCRSGEPQALPPRLLRRPSADHAPAHRLPGH